MEPYVQIAGILVGAYTALQGIYAWKVQKIGTKQIEIAEDLIVSIIKFRESMTVICNEFVINDDYMGLCSKLSAEIGREKALFVAQCAYRNKLFEDYKSDFNQFMGKRFLAIAYFGDNFHVHFRNFQKIYISSHVSWSRIAESHNDGGINIIFDHYNKLYKKTVISFDEKTENGEILNEITRKAMKDIHNILVRRSNVDRIMEWLWG